MLGDNFDSFHMAGCERAKLAPMNAELVTKQGDVVERTSERCSRQIETLIILPGLIVSTFYEIKKGSQIYEELF